MSELPESVVDAILAHVDAVAPNEACGYLVGLDGQVTRFVAVTNVAASPTRFVFDPHEQLAAERAIEAAGESVIGIAHSHPAGPAWPSATDIADATAFDPFGVLLHVVVAGATRDIGRFWIRAGRVEPLD